MKAFFAELRRRNVVRMGLLYAVAGWLLLQVADVLFGLMELPGWSLRLVLAILLLGFPLVLVFAWVFEMTPAGLKRAAQVERERSITALTGQKLNTAIVAVLAVALLLTLSDRLFRPAAVLPQAEQSAAATGAAGGVEVLAAADAPSIAVLPFVNMSGEAENEYFSDGLSEELLNVLAQVPGLRVAARTSSFQFKGHTGDVSEIARQLKVGTILEGSVRRSGERVRVTAQLINAADGYHLWSSTYDRQMLDVFAIQDEIASKVVEALRITLLGKSQRALTTGRTRDFEAYNDYLMARQLQAQGSYGSLVKAEQLLKQVLARDPNYRDALTALVETHVDQAWTGKISYREAQTEARPWLEQVRRLDAERGEERGDVLGLEAELDTLAVVASVNNDAQVREARRRLMPMFERAIELNPNGVRTYLRLARLEMFEDDFDSATELLASARQLDPLSLDVSMLYLNLYNAMDQPDLALDEASRMQQISPGSPTGYWLEARTLGEEGRFYEAVRVTEKARQVDPDDHEIAASMAEFYLAMGDVERAAPWVDQALAMEREAPDTYRARLLLAMARDEPAQSTAIAREILDKGIENRSGTQFFAGAVLAWDAYDRGDHEAALNWLRTVHSASFRDPVRFELPGETQFALAWVVPVLRKAGQADRVNRILTAAQAFMDSFDFVASHEQRRQVRLASMLAWQRGAGDQALAAFAESMEQRPFGSLWWLFMLKNPLLQDLASAPPVAAGLQAQQARYQAMARRLREEDGYQVGER